MKKLLPAICLLGGLVSGGLFAASPYEVPHKSVSNSGEFVIYCDNLAMRLAVSSFCEDTKSGILNLLDQKHDVWNIPIVINLLSPDATLPGQPLSQIQLFNVEGGSRKIELDIVLRGQLADIHFQQLVVHAILIEMEYRDKPAWKEGVPAIEPPPWLVQGLSTYLKNRNSEVDVDVYKALLKNGQVPTLVDFLSQTTAGMNAASLKLYDAYSYSFLQLLVTLQDGQQSLGRYIHDLPVGQDTPSQDLIKHFPALGGSPENLEKWWTLSMARLAASDRYRGLSMEETEQRLVSLLKFKFPTGKGSATREFSIEDFPEFVKNPLASKILDAASTNLQVFAAEANPLYRPIIAEYLKAIEEVKSGKVKGTADELKNVAKYRQMILTRMDQVADYLNWFEATQMVNRSNSFEDYMTTAKEISNDAPTRDDAISRYLDSLEVQMQ